MQSISVLNFLFSLLTHHCVYTVNRSSYVRFLVQQLPGTHRTPHSDRELMFAHILHNLYIKVMKFTCQKACWRSAHFQQFLGTVNSFHKCTKLHSVMLFPILAYLCDKYFNEPEKYGSHSVQQSLSSWLLSDVLNPKLQRYVTQHLWAATFCTMAWPNSVLQFGAIAAP
jgi:hypothetical protein